MLFHLRALSIGYIFVAQLRTCLCQHSSTLTRWWPFSPSAQNSDTNDVYDGSNFKIFWNVPTRQCHKHGLNFSQVSYYGIMQNSNDEFRGDKIALLYDPGEFPALLKGGAESTKRNGGVPQEGDLQRHLDIFEKHLTEQLVPEANFSGLGIIDFEHWRPIFHQNFGSLEPYRKESISLVRKQHWFWSADAVEKEAERLFEKAAEDFIASTLKSAQRLRPQGKWGYYGFPLCFNFTPYNNRAKCKLSAIKENDRIQWLFSGSEAVYPSLYYKKKDLTTDQRAEFMAGRVVEAVRLAQGKPVVPYTWLKYYDQTSEFVAKVDFVNSIRVPKKHGATGVIIWGSSNDVNTEKKCRQMLAFLENVVGPAVKQTTSFTNKKHL